MHDELKDRLKKFLAYKNINPNAFSKLIGVSQTSIKQALEGTTLPSSKVLIPAKTNFPDLNVNWLLVGEGSMLIDQLETDAVQQYKDYIKILKENIQFKDRDLEAKDEEIEMLKKQLEVLNNTN